MPLEMADLLQMTKDELICQTKDGRTIAVKKDGTGSRTVDPGAELPQDTRVELSAEGVLRLNGSVISNSAVQAVNDGVFLYYTERMGALYLLRVSPMQNDMQPLTLGSRDANAAALTGKSIPEPLNLTVSKDAVVLTTTDHRVIVMDLNKGTTEELAALSRETLSACMVNGVVYRYHHANDRTWVIESGVAETAATMKPAATETMKPAETAQPTATPRPAATAKPTENKSGNESLIDDDGTIHYGARGNTVKKIQKRLADLGYPVGSADGKYGNDTQVAIDLFCEAIGAKLHNYIPKKVQNKLFADDAPYCVFDMYMPLKKGDKGGNVRLMQKRLKDLGYDPGTVDGSYGKNTVAAVARFQAAYDIARRRSEQFQIRSLSQISKLPEHTKLRQFFCQKQTRPVSGSSDQIVCSQNTKRRRDSVRSGRYDSARVARTFANRIKTAQIFRFTQCVAADTDRGGGARFGTGQDGVRIRKASKLGVHGTNSFFQVFCDPVRQNSPKISRNNAGTIRRRDFTKGDRSPVLKKISNPLCRRDEMAAARTERRFFDTALENKTGQRVIIPEILGFKPDQQGGIAVDAVTGMQAHAVGHDSAGLGSRSDDFTARTHTEGINTPAVRSMTDQLIRRGTKRRMAGEGSILGTVNERTGMFNPHTHGKGFLLHTKALAEKRLNCIPCRMTDTQQDSVSQEFAQLSVAGKHRAFYMTAADDQLFQTGFKIHRTAKTDNFIPYGRDDAFETVCADMRFLINKDLLRRAV